jgi:hypothetical protein
MVHVMALAPAAEDVAQDVGRAQERQGADDLGRDGQPEELPVGEGHGVYVLVFISFVLA